MVLLWPESKGALQGQTNFGNASSLHCCPPIACSAGQYRNPGTFQSLSINTLVAGINVECVTSPDHSISSIWWEPKNASRMSGELGRGSADALASDVRWWDKMDVTGRESSKALIGMGRSRMSCWICCIEGIVASINDVKKVGCKIIWG